MNDKLNSMLGKVDEKMLKVKLNNALNTLKKGNMEDLSKKINKIDKTDLAQKIDEIDIESLKQNSGLNIEEIKKQVSESDLQKLSALLGNDGDTVMRKIKEILK